MKKRLIALVVVGLLIVPMLTQSAVVQTAEDFTPSGVLATVDFSVTGRLKTFLEPLIREEINGMPQTDPDKLRLQVIADQLLKGERFFLGVPADLQSLTVSFKASDAQWTTLTSNFEKEAYEGTDIYFDESTYMAHLGEYAVLGQSPAAIQKAVDLADGRDTESLSKSSSYAAQASSLLSPRLLGATLDLKTIAAILKEALAEQEGADLFDIFDYFTTSVSEATQGYRFTLKMQGIEAKLREKNVSFAPGGSFTPNLYKKMPAAKLLLYSESFNPNAELLQSKSLLGEDGIEGIFDQIKDETGLDINKVYAALNKEMAFAIQYNNKFSIPYITLLANVTGSEAAAKTATDELIDAVLGAFEDGEVPTSAYKVSKTGGVTTITMDLTKFEEDYDGPPFPKLQLTFGVTGDGLLIVSTYPNIADGAVRTGLQSANAEFAALANETGDNTGIFYLNARNFWGWFDGMLEWAEKVTDGNNGPDLEFYQGYYGALDSLYVWKDLFIKTEGNESSVLVTGTVGIDTAQHKTYDQLLQEWKSKDSDSDGLSDYDERFLYHTPVGSADSDGDGIPDHEALARGLNPRGEGRIFKDVSEGQYYTAETAFLSERGCISGYEDGTFQPGRNINRAEFTTMIVGCFEQGTSRFLGVNVELSKKAPPFADIDKNEWYYGPVAKAYGAGFISGSGDTSGRLVFRPGDNITRAEALAILNKASQSLLKTRATASCARTPFTDVSEDDWFCGAVANGYDNGVTRGKAPDSFKPHDFLNRAEAAVMIRRTLEKDIEKAAEGTKTIGETIAGPDASILQFFKTETGGALPALQSDPASGGASEERDVDE